MRYYKTTVCETLRNGFVTIITSHQGNNFDVLWQTHVLWVKHMFLRRTFGVMNDHAFLCLQITRSDIRSQVKWAVSLMNADGHFQSCSGACVGMYELTYSLRHSRASPEMKIWYYVICLFPFPNFISYNVLYRTIIFAMLYQPLKQLQHSCRLLWSFYVAAHKWLFPFITVLH